jgi:hypothetical protein
MEAEDDDELQMFEHLNSCASCRGFLRSVLASKNGIQEESRLAAPSRLDERVLIAFERKHEEKRFPGAIARFRRAKLTIRVPLAASFFLALVLGVLYLSLVKTEDHSQAPIPVVKAQRGMSLPVIRVTQ